MKPKLCAEAEIFIHPSGGLRLFHVCNAGAALRSARAEKLTDPFADAVMQNAQSLLNKAAVLLAKIPSKGSSHKESKPLQKEANKESVLHDSAGVGDGTGVEDSANSRPSLTNQLKHAAQTLSVSSCILQNSVDVLNDAVKALQNEYTNSEQDSVQPEGDAPTDEKPETVQITEQITDPPSSSAPLCAGETSSIDTLNCLNSKVHEFTNEVASLLTELQESLRTPHRSQAYIRLAQKPLEEIRQIILILAPTEGTEFDDENEASGVLRDLVMQHALLKKLLATPAKIEQKLKQPKDKHLSQPLVIDLQALKKTVSQILPLPLELSF